MILARFLLLFFFTCLSHASTADEYLTENDVVLSYRILGQNPNDRARIAVVKMSLYRDDYPLVRLEGYEYLKRPVPITSARIHSEPEKGARCVLVDAGHRISKIFTFERPLSFPADHIFGDASWATSYFYCFTENEARPDMHPGQ